MVKKIINKTNLNIQEFITCHVIKDIDEERRINLLKSFEYCNVNGYILEFGVFKGTTINTISNYFKNQLVYGFDSFEGLPEPWYTKKKSKKTSFDKNHFKVSNLPKVNENVELVKGYFDKSLPIWLVKHQGPISFLHIDCDLYSSTKTIFNLLNKMIVKDTVIVFDELYSWEDSKYSNWEEGEWKALVEWVQEFDREFEILHRNRHMQATIKITK